MTRYCLTVDLIDDPTAISEYEEYHKAVWPEILQSLSDAGILQMEIYRLGVRMMMIIEVSETFSFQRKAAMDSANPAVQKWEALMWKYQSALPMAAPGEKWMRMEKVFDMQSQL